MRAGAAAVTLRPRRVELPTLLRGLKRAVSRTGEAVDARVESVTVDCPQDLVVRTDPDLLTSILMNFLGNAIRYGEPPLQVVARRERDTAVIEVIDHGPGIARERLEHLFDRYHRGAESDSAGGLGLGLFIARCAADLLDARLDVESRPGVGSTFRVLLPDAARTATATA
jgi:signal transduction histidine kinase